MNTPIYDFLKKYSESDMLRCHMPGHKGQAIGNFADLQALYSLDITEISGADSLFEADGIIAESEQNMSQLYGSAATVYSAGGSTLCIQTMLALMKLENRRFFAVRNVHRAFLNAAALLDIEVEWIMPEYKNGILSGTLNLDKIEKALSACSEKACLYVTSPDYTGRLADISALSEICRKYDARFLVDNAHGAHLAFLDENIHPIKLGADLCCDSAHKMLPALTGAAMLHTSGAELAPLLKQTMTLFASTSPSYLIMASLDLCVDYISQRIHEDIRENLNNLRRFREYFSDRLCFVEGEPFHLTIDAAESGYNGIELARELRENGVECEYSDSSIVILLMSPMNRNKDYSCLTRVLNDILPTLVRYNVKSEPFALSLPQNAMSIREAVFAPSEEIPVERSAGRICSAVKVPCPPAVPIAVSGEIITPEHIKIFKKYSISTVNVVK